MLEEVGLLDHDKGIHRFAGTSGGALIAGLLAIRMKVSDMKKLFEEEKKNWIIGKSIVLQFHGHSQILHLIYKPKCFNLNINYFT